MIKKFFSKTMDIIFSPTGLYMSFITMWYIPIIEDFKYYMITNDFVITNVQLYFIFLACAWYIPFVKILLSPELWSQKIDEDKFYIVKTFGILLVTPVMFSFIPSFCIYFNVKALFLMIIEIEKAYGLWPFYEGVLVYLMIWFYRRL